MRVCVCAHQVEMERGERESENVKCGREISRGTHLNSLSHFHLREFQLNFQTHACCCNFRKFSPKILIPVKKIPEKMKF